MGSIEITEENLKQTMVNAFGDNCVFCILMGSALTDRFNDQSDIDLAVYFVTEPSFSELSRLNLLLSDQFERDVDLVSLNRIDPVFARQVLETGRPLLIADLAFFNVWKAQQISLYPDFKESRLIIENNLLNRKKYV